LHAPKALVQPAEEFFAVTKKVDLQDVYRNARTGRFVTERYADRHPSTTEHERRPLPSPAHKHQPPRKGKRFRERKCRSSGAFSFQGQ